MGENQIFIMNGGTISHNTSSAASSAGGGVYVEGTFIMNEGTISGHTVANSGGAVFNNGIFTMSGGTISGNTAKWGGGVYHEYHAARSSPFTKTGGVIYGSNASGSQKNTATDGNNYGHAVYVTANEETGAAALKRNTTAGAGVNLNLRLTGSEGGWE
ncbi:MAG: hypothetical protein LBR16_06690 [Treponema sp.]|nr:hypothetical protein [Treponema sp.]